jgi:hydrogenase maturation protease
MSIPDNNTMKVVILGLGNILLADDGVGVKVIEFLRQNFTFPPYIELIDGGVKGLELLSVIEGTSHLLIIDAIDIGEESGAVVNISVSEILTRSPFLLSPHQIGLKDILGAARLSNFLPRYSILIGIQPEVIELGLELSEPVKLALPKLTQTVLKQLQDWGIEIIKSVDP